MWDIAMLIAAAVVILCVGVIIGIWLCQKDVSRKDAQIADLQQVILKLRNNS